MRLKKINQIKQKKQPELIHQIHDPGYQSTEITL